MIEIFTINHYWIFYKMFVCFKLNLSTLLNKKIYNYNYIMYLIYTTLSQFQFSCNEE